jgi:hypothetical protein
VVEGKIGKQFFSTLASEKKGGGNSNLKQTKKQKTYIITR